MSKTKKMELKPRDIFKTLESYGAVLNIILSNRTLGKSWAMFIRTWYRAYTRGKKAIIIRRFKKEVKEMAKKAYSSTKQMQLCKGLQLYDPNTKKGNFKRCGNYFYIKRGGRWEWFLQIATLGDSNALRSADDDQLDTIFFDEFTTTPRKYALYRGGNEVDDFMDIFFSMKREHKITIFMFGNREYTTNPYFTYFGIPSMPAEYEGVRRYKHKTIIVKYVNNEQKDGDDYDNKVKFMLEGTRYGDYIYKSQYKQGTHAKIARAPKDANIYCCLRWAGNLFTIKYSDGYYYISPGVVPSARIYTDDITNEYSKETKLIKRQRILFDAFIDAISSNRVRYSSQDIYISTIPFMQFLGI